MANDEETSSPGAIVESIVRRVHPLARGLNTSKLSNRPLLGKEISKPDQLNAIR